MRNLEISEDIEEKSFKSLAISLNLNDAESNPKKSLSLIGVMILFLSIFGMASIPPFMNLYGDVNTFTKNLWKAELNLLASIPLAYFSFRSCKDTWDWEFIKSTKGNLILMLNGTVFAGASATFIASSWLTISSHTLILGCLAGVFLILYKIWICEPTHLYEKLGTVVVVIGSVILMSDKNVEKVGNDVSILGDILGVVSSFIYAFYLPLNKYIITRVPVFYAFMYTSFTSLLWFLLVNIIYCDVELKVFFSMHPKYGFLGWFSNDQLKISVFLIAPFWGVCGNALDVFSLKYFDSHIIGNSHLLEPFIGQMIGYLIGQEKLPGILTYVGAIIIMWGIYKTAEGNAKMQEMNSTTERSELSNNFEELLSE
jgi:drug/metabolite transporter (DMT)-like permease